MLTLGRGGENVSDEDSCSFTGYGDEKWTRFHCFRLLYVLSIDLLDCNGFTANGTIIDIITAIVSF